jgi:DNA-binding response OmpR family regulator
MKNRVLLIDDDVEKTRILADLLGREGFEVRAEFDSREARRAALEFGPDVVVLDFIMPNKNGADVAWEFACSPRLSNVPLIVVTGFAEAVKRSTLPPCAIQILSKPATVEALVAAIESCTGRG